MTDSVVNYFKHALEELKKVAWPSRGETLQKTMLVVIISLAIAAYLGLLDYMFTLALERVV
ncbi:MAG: preprotein translocase subunit SecE [Candidatus Jacksonbacteria bacterium RIFCSPLOWO2_02_FULL_44_20]|uniref:Protein translocase subunit SecE n=1 Tax=Candidatus Jacksonbacteria bacterium RIFCSPLOWO2_02_FULL_44_20 TaxID=1798460 RepID=A0A1G2A9K8_9BACT|nr:MAG: preprotein translocase subunit SecE [Candidatus Jacksonbacteria bacterium RIFCSPHIGHO2_12_FULL_44_12]OGY70859.1 MAG: preprotein translocase subunit SecE [Candidatus Jacksonbacteria bacterium RIFCSPHIGHO2_02_FULL_44_25]OGY73593.1 MAG: preprotein translocase subunit SecE [Candidatus Jacksonbacteria bacterium RIFCSPLOWO2_02_FULL_44_20]OGY74751.1 MAG: preprotein translocase subunit SecE [Candidatus Jacksonbacteria bacterium RIFCSPLOWO2_12_FULL_44_15b]HCA67474.1 preprotein translocase subuni